MAYRKNKLELAIREVPKEVIMVDPTIKAGLIHEILSPADVEKHLVRDIEFSMDLSEIPKYSQKIDEILAKKK